MTPDLEDYNAWRERMLLEPPDVSPAAYLKYLEAQAALELVEKQKEITE